MVYNGWFSDIVYQSVISFLPAHNIEPLAHVSNFSKNKHKLRKIFGFDWSIINIL